MLKKQKGFGLGFMRSLSKKQEKTQNVLKKQVKRTLTKRITEIREEQSCKKKRKKLKNVLKKQVKRKLTPRELLKYEKSKAVLRRKLERIKVLLEQCRADVC